MIIKPLTRCDYHFNARYTLSEAQWAFSCKRSRDARDLLRITRNWLELATLARESEQAVRS